MKTQKIFFSLFLAVLFIFGAKYASADTWLSGAIDDGGFGNCHYEQYTSYDTNGDGVTDEISVEILHGHWSGGVGGLCVLSVVVSEEEGASIDESLIFVFWNFIMESVKTGVGEIMN